MKRLTPLFVFLLLVFLSAPPALTAGLTNDAFHSSERYNLRYAWVYSKLYIPEPWESIPDLFRLQYGHYKSQMTTIWEITEAATFRFISREVRRPYLSGQEPGWEYVSGFSSGITNRSFYLFQTNKERESLIFRAFSVDYPARLTNSQSFYESSGLIDMRSYNSIEIMKSGSVTRTNRGEMRSTWATNENEVFATYFNRFSDNGKEEIWSRKSHFDLQIRRLSETNIRIFLPVSNHHLTLTNKKASVYVYDDAGGVLELNTETPSIFRYSISNGRYTNNIHFIFQRFEDKKWGFDRRVAYLMKIKSGCTRKSIVRLTSASGTVILRWESGRYDGGKLQAWSIFNRRNELMQQDVITYDNKGRLAGIDENAFPVNPAQTDRLRLVRKTRIEYE